MCRCGAHSSVMGKPDWEEGHTCHPDQRLGVRRWLQIRLLVCVRPAWAGDRQSRRNQRAGGSGPGVSARAPNRPVPPIHAGAGGGGGPGCREGPPATEGPSGSASP